MQIKGSSTSMSMAKLGSTLSTVSWVSKHPVTLSDTSMVYNPSSNASYPAVAGSPLTVQIHVPTAGSLWSGQAKVYPGPKTQRDTLS